MPAPAAVKEIVNPGIPTRTEEAKPNLNESPSISPSPAREAPRTKTTLNLQDIGKAPVKPPEEKKAEEKPVVSAQADKPIDLESLKKVWNEFAELRKGQVAEYQLLKREFALRDNKVIITLNNLIEEPFLAGLRTSLIAYLRDKLSNSSLLVVGELQEVDSSRPMLYTNKEKFEYLLSKNPVLKDLQERLGLDADY